MKLEHRNNCIIVKFMPDDKDEADGTFDADSGKIYIRDKLNLLERECVYYHELSHKECYDKKCSCWNNDYWCEYHALRGEMNKIIARNSRRLCWAYLMNMQAFVNKCKKNPKLWRVHLAAVRRLMKTKTYWKLRRIK